MIKRLDARVGQKKEKLMTTKAADKEVKEQLANNADFTAKEVTELSKFTKRLNHLVARRLQSKPQKVEN